MENVTCVIIMNSCCDVFWTNSASVYFTDENQKKTLLTTIEPTKEGRLCFFINQLGKYELVYNQ